MDALARFKRTIQERKPPELGGGLLALYHDALGEWHEAHEIAQAMHDSYGALIHAYLHRKEGDLDNADYWYARAGRSRPRASLEAEWDQIATELLAERTT